MILLCKAGSCFAQASDTGYKFSAGAAYVQAIPLGAFSRVSSNRFFAGQSISSPALELNIAVRLNQHFKLGLNIADMVFQVDRNKFRDQLYAMYGSADYYTAITIYKSRHEVGSVALTGYYMLQLPIASVEPYVVLGMGFGNTGISNNLYAIHRKRKGDNFSDDVNSDIVRSDNFFFPGVGLQLTRQLWKGLYGRLGVQYNYGEYNYRISDDIRDYIGNNGNQLRDFRQPVSVLQVQVGAEVRIYKLSKYRMLREQRCRDEEVEPETK
jgi:hypothetical protein